VDKFFDGFVIGRCDRENFLKHLKALNSSNDDYLYNICLPSRNVLKA
jgi:hypothetical protein